MTWAIRDGLGMVGGLLFSYVASSHFDAHVKEFRLVADVLNDVGLTLDMALPVVLSWTSWFSSPGWTGVSYLPSTYLVLTSLSTLCKVACGISAGELVVYCCVAFIICILLSPQLTTDLALGATKGNITDHFSISGNRADVSAKESTQETLVSLIGMALGVWLSKWLQTLEKLNKSAACINDEYTCDNPNATTSDSSITAMLTDVQSISWIIFIVLTVIHVWANYVGVQRLHLRTLNRARARIALQSYIETCGTWVLSGDKCISNGISIMSNMLPPSPSEISEPLWKSIISMFNNGNVHLGMRVRDLVKRTNQRSKEEWSFIYDQFKHDNYMVFVESDDVYVMMRMGASESDELRAFLTAHVLQWCIERDDFPSDTMERQKHRRENLVAR